MRKKFYFLLVAMAFCASLTAQNFEYQLGLKGAVGMDWIRVLKSDYTSKDNGFTYHFGLTGVYYLDENYGFSSGFNIIGNQFSYKNVSEYDYRTTYFQIPFLLKMRTDEFGSSMRFFGEIGYGFDVLIDGTYKVNDVKEDNPYRDVCSSFILHLGIEMNVLNRSTLQFMLGYDNYFSSMMTMSQDKLTISNAFFEIGFLF